MTRNIGFGFLTVACTALLFLMANTVQAQNCVNCQTTTITSVQTYNALPASTFNVVNRVAAPVRTVAGTAVDVVQNARANVQAARCNAQACRHERAAARANARASYFNALPRNTFSYYSVSPEVVTYSYYPTAYRAVIRAGNCGCPNCICGDNCNCHAAPVSVVEEVAPLEVLEGAQ